MKLMKNFIVILKGLDLWKMKPTNGEKMSLEKHKKKI